MSNTWIHQVRHDFETSHITLTSLSSHIHVHTTNLLNVTCTLVATGAMSEMSEGSLKLLPIPNHISALSVFNMWIHQVRHDYETSHITLTSLSSHIHVYIANLLNVTCTLVGTGVYLKPLPITKSAPKKATYIWAPYYFRAFVLEE